MFNMLKNVRNRFLRPVLAEMCDMNKKLDDLCTHISKVNRNILEKIDCNAHNELYSYSQSGEDRIILYIINQLNLNLKNFLYVDIGASEPIGHNNTYLFYTLGAQGYIIEADPKYFEAYSRLRPKDIAINAAIAPANMIDKNHTIPFFRCSEQGWSTIDNKHFELARQLGKADETSEEIIVPALSFGELYNNYLINKNIDFLSIDIEGIDSQVFQEMNFSIFSPAIICLEICHISNDINMLLNSKGYIKYASTFINNIYIKNNVLNNMRF